MDYENNEFVCGRLVIFLKHIFGIFTKIRNMLILWGYNKL